jgi:DMSO/TMAO reductase YedYZ molybdopterin-dependent catalytic subunit
MSKQQLSHGTEQPQEEYSRRRRKLIALFPLVFLAGCDFTAGAKTESLLKSFQTFNDWVQAKVFDPDTLAPEYADDQVTPEEGFRVNGYDTDEPDIDMEHWKLTIEGLVSKPGEYTLEQIKAFPKRNMNVRHCCVEGWSMIPKWGGMPMRELMMQAGVEVNAKYVKVECGDEYFTSYDLKSILHSQTLLAYEAYNKPLSLQHGAPVRIVMPTKLGYKSAKWVNKITVTNEKPGGYWEDQGYDWFAGL